MGEGNANPLPIRSDMDDDNDVLKVGCGCLIYILAYAFAIGWAVLWWNIGTMALEGMGTGALICLYPILGIWCASPFISVTGSLLK